jgi:hypothetical protein
MSQNGVILGSRHSCGIGIEADATAIGIQASSTSVRYLSILVPDWGTLIPVPDSPAFDTQNYTKGMMTEGSSVRL